MAAALAALLAPPGIPSLGGGQPSAQPGTVSTQPLVVILANSIDRELAGDLIDLLSFIGFEVQVVGAGELSTVADAPRIIILGGPDAYEGVGAIVRTLLNSSLQEAVRAPGASFIVAFRDVWADGQVVVVAAGSDRYGTQRAHREGRQSLLEKVAPPLEVRGREELGGVVITTGLAVAPGGRLELSDDLLLVSLGPVSIEGEVVGDCRSLAIVANSSVSLLNSLVNVSCATQRVPPGIPEENYTGPGLLIWGQGNVTIENSTLVGEGDILLSNGPNPADLANVSMSGGNFSHGMGWQAPALGGAIPAWWRPGWPLPPMFPPGPPPQPPAGARIPRNFIVRRGRVVQRNRFGCRWFGGSPYILFSAFGNLYLDGVEIQSRDGRDGCDKTGRGTVRAGRGENGASIWIFVDGWFPFGLDISGRLIMNSTTLETGWGGDGGDATAEPGPDGNAKAYGGDGGRGGEIRVEAVAGIELRGQNRFKAGWGGDGGDAEAHGRDGNPGCPGGRGGNAEAYGGNGGGGAWVLIRSPGVTGPNPVVTEGQGGDGGDAYAFPGDGGLGNGPGCAGGRGGDAVAVGGDGGKAILRGVAPRGGFVGGDGGDAYVRGGNGGRGGNGCVEGEVGPGGDGGRGGDVRAWSGAGGKGTLGNGEPGDVELENASNGGRGGDGSPPGSGGAPGTADLNARGGSVSKPDSLQKGGDGAPCELPGLESRRAGPAGRGGRGVDLLTAGLPAQAVALLTVIWLARRRGREVGAGG